MSAETTPRHAPDPRRAILAAVQLPGMSDDRLARSLDELRRLAEGLGVTIVDTVTQRRESDRSTRIFGKGWLAQLAERFDPAADPPLDLLLINNELTPGQQFVLEKATKVEVMDRTAIILEVFETRARTHIARLELEIARLDYAVPRMRDLDEPDREGGGGRAERGHTQAELRRQQARMRRAALRKQIDAARAADDMARSRRDAIPVAALVGYTNAGKSSLMRALTGDAVYVADKLFATLGSTVRALEPPTDPKTLIADTVGFIEDLPHALVRSFHSTLMEARAADLLLFVVDAADPFREQQLTVSRRTVAELATDETHPMAPDLLVFNKVDRLTPEARDALQATHPDALLVSAFDPDAVARLRAAIEAHMRQGRKRHWLRVPFALGHLIAKVHAEGRVIGEAYDAEGALVEVEIDAAGLGRLEKLGVQRGEAPAEG